MASPYIIKINKEKWTAIFLTAWDLIMCLNKVWVVQLGAKVSFVRIEEPCVSVFVLLPEPIDEVNDGDD